MALKNHQYQAILRSYDATRQKHRRELDERRKTIYEKIPKLKQLDDQIVEMSIQQAKLSLMGDASALNGLAEKNKTCSLKKAELLQAAGFSADYLELQYTCPDCKDTGYIDKEKCHCFKQEIINVVYSQSNIKNIL